MQNYWGHALALLHVAIVTCGSQTCGLEALGGANIAVGQLGPLAIRDEVWGAGNHERLLILGDGLQLQAFGILLLDERGS